MLRSFKQKKNKIWSIFDITILNYIQSIITIKFNTKSVEIEKLKHTHIYSYNV